MRERVSDLDAAISEIARVLKTGGVFVFDPINRTRMIRFVMIKLFQEWRLTAWLPANLHACEQFITPEELRTVMSRHQLEGQEIVGIGPSAIVPRLMWMLWQLRQRRISPGELGRRAHFVLMKDVRVSYAGYATKAA